MDRFFILDCNGQIVGNVAGYQTIRGAIREERRKGSPAWHALWDAYEKKRSTDPEWRHVSKIVGFDSLTHDVRGLIGSRLEN